MRTLFCGLAVGILGSAAGCSPAIEPSPPPELAVSEPALTAELARAAILERMRSGDIFGFDAADWAEVELQAEDGGWYDLGGAIRLNPSTKSYTVVLRPQPGARACTFTSAGAFLREEGKWVAGPTRAVQSALGGGE